MRIVLIKDVQAAHLGLDAEMGLLYPAGAILDSCLPHIEEKLLAEGLAVPEEEWQKQQPQRPAKARSAPASKRGRGASEDKAR